MKIGIIVGHPTQFEGPFFRYAAQDSAHCLRVIYTDADRMNRIIDPELEESVSWGIDLLSGYDYAVLPEKGRISWLWREIKRENYELLIINGYNKMVYVLAAVLSRMYGTPTALRLDSVLFNNTSKLKLITKYYIFSLLFKLYNHFFAVGSLTIDYLRYFHVPIENISVFTYAVDVDYFKRESTPNADSKHILRSQLGIPTEAKVILSVAKFNRRESPWDLLRAFSKIESDDLWLVLVGDGNEKQDLEDFSKSIPGDRIRFPGYIQYPKLPSYYGISDVFVHPSSNEPWGVSVAEAMACGLPVIASSRVGSAVDLIVAGRNGHIYENGNPDDLREKLLNVLSVMKKQSIENVNLKVLSSWNYQKSWQNIKDACIKSRINYK